jgi:hypothetical protein
LPVFADQREHKAAGAQFGSHVGLCGWVSVGDDNDIPFRQFIKLAHQILHLLDEERVRRGVGKYDQRAGDP